MTPDRMFRQARELLMRTAGDYEAARAAFQWPALDEFNRTTHWFDDLASGNRRDALRIVSDGVREHAVDESSSTATTVERLTFDELADRSRRVARYLRDAGVARGDRMLVMLTNVAPLWETVLAAMRLGAVMIPATTQLTSDDIDDRLVRGGVRHVVVDAASAGRIDTAAHTQLRVKLLVGDVRAGGHGARGFVSFDEARAAPARVDQAPTRADDLLLYFTSGTTARPEVVLHTHASYPVGHLSTMYWLGLREGDVHQNISSPGWAKHAWSSFFAPWNAGATVLVHDAARLSARRAVTLLREQAVTTLCAPPTVWRLIVLEPLGDKPEALRELASAGEPLNPEVIATVAGAWGITIRDGYGQTETTAQIGNTPGMLVKPGSMGKPLPGYDVVLIDGDGRPCEGGPGEEGELALRLSPRPMGLMHGYLDDPARTDAATGAGVYRTGDEARRDADGYIFFVGRGDDVFKSSDYRISPFELESVLLEHDAVAEAAVVPSPDALRLAVPKAFIVLRPGVEESRDVAQSLFAFCRSALAPYKRIRRLEFAVLPKTISGKIRRVELRQREAARVSSGERGPSEFWSDDV
jgi:acetyl-CoA synthetase